MAPRRPAAPPAEPDAAAALAALRLAFSEPQAPASRNVRIFMRYFTPFEGRATLRGIGADMGLTRERVRQVVEAVAAGSKRHRLRAPLAAAVDALGSASPVRVDAVSPGLAAPGQLLRLAKALGVDAGGLSLEVVRGAEVLAFAADAKALRAALASLERQTARRGLADVPTAVRAGTRDAALQPRLRRFMLRDMPRYPLAWVAADGRCAQFGPACAKLSRNIGKALALYGAIEERDFVSGLLRLFRRGEVDGAGAAHREAMLSAAAALPFAERSGGCVRAAGAPPASPGEDAGDAFLEDRIAAHVLARGQASIKEIMARFGLPRTLVAPILCYSALLLPTGRPGVYRALAQRPADGPG